MTVQEHIGTIFFASLFAVLIWLWAEGENRGQRADSLQVIFRTEGPGDFVISVLDAADQTARRNTMMVQVTLEGPNQGLERVLRNRQPLVVLVNDPIDGRERSMTLLDELHHQQRFVVEGVTVQRVDPPVVSIRADEMIRVATPIRAEIDGYEFDEIEVIPAEVSVRLPRSLWLGVVQPQIGESFIQLGLTSAMLRRLAPGEPERFHPVRLRLDDRLMSYESLIEFEPPTVEVRLTLSSRLFERTQTVTVKVLKLPRDELLYDVMLVEEEHETLRDVLVTGDAAAIARLDNREVTIVAVLNMSTDDLEKGVTEKRVEWSLPPGLFITQEPPLIPIRIERRREE